MIVSGRLQYGFVVAVDIEGFSALHTWYQAQAQADLSRILHGAAANADLGRDRWYRQSRGDGELAVIPLTTDPSWVVARFTEEVALALSQHRARSPVAPRLRLRMSMHMGSMAAGDFGPVGDAPIVACRLLDALAVRKALLGAPEVDLVLVLSERLYCDVVESGFHGLCPDRFRRVRATVKGRQYAGRLCLGSPCVTEVDLAQVYAIGSLDHHCDGVRLEAC